MAESGPKLGIAGLAAAADPRSFPHTGAAAPPAPALPGLELEAEADAYEPAPDSMPFPQRKGPGRPKGSPNRRTAEFARYILTRHGDLLSGLAAVAFMPIDDLARDLGCTKLEAFDRWLKTREALLPYVHAKLPAEAVIKHETLPTLVIGELHVGTGGAVQLGAEGVRALSIGPSEENQGLSAVIDAKSHDAQSHGEG